MKKYIMAGVVLLLLISVLTIFISPAVDLEPTALRAAKLANLLLAMLALAGTILIARSHIVFAFLTTAFERDLVLQPAPNLVDLNCTRLC